MKKALTIVAIVLAVAAVVSFVRSCQADAALKQAKADYEELRRIADADHAMSKDHIAELEASQEELKGMIDSQATIIASKEATISSLKKSVVASNATTEALRNEVQPVLDQNPKVAQLVASLDAGILLRDTLITEQTTVINSLKERIALGDQRFDNQVKISNEWKAMYEREQTLRVAAENLFKLSERRVSRNKLVTKVALGVAAGAVIYSVVHK